MKRGEVWWVAFGRTEGGEITKTRPAVILSNDHANAILNRIVVVPLTSSEGELFPSEAFVNTKARKSKAMADQIRAISKSRLRGRMEVLSSEDVLAVEKAVLLHLGFIVDTE